MRHDRQDDIPRVGIRRSHVIVVGRYLYVFIPVVDSILDTIFWGDGFKSLLHLFLFSYLSYQGLCGIRFMLLLLAAHAFWKVRRPSQCTDDEAVLAFKTAIYDMHVFLRRWQPSSAWVWSAILAAIAASWCEALLEIPLWEAFNASIGPASILVILLCYGIVDPRPE